MPVTPASAAARAAAQRMIDFPNIEGNTVMLHKLVYEDPDAINAFRGELEASGATAEAISVAALAAQRCSNVMECCGNTGLWPLMGEAAVALIGVVDEADAAEPKS